MTSQKPQKSATEWRWMKDKGQNNNHNLSECQKSIFTLSTQCIDLHLIDSTYTKRDFSPHWIACSTIQILFMINLGGKNNPVLFKEFSLKYLSLLRTDWKTHSILQTHVYRGLWLDLLMLFDGTRGTIRNLGGKTHVGKLQLLFSFLFGGA